MYIKMTDTTLSVYIHLYAIPFHVASYMVKVERYRLGIYINKLAAINVMYIYQGIGGDNKIT
jgi:hypothetical protein